MKIAIRQVPKITTTLPPFNVGLQNFVSWQYKEMFKIS